MWAGTMAAYDNNLRKKGSRILIRANKHLSVAAALIIAGTMQEFAQHQSGYCESDWFCC